MDDAEVTPLDANWDADALQALVSMLPWVGSPASSAVASARSNKANAYVKKRLIEIDDALKAVGANLDGLLDSDRFNAGVHRIVPQYLATESEEKRAFLRHALINGYVRDVAGLPRDTFGDIVVRYSPVHVRLLHAMSVAQPHHATEYRPGGLSSFYATKLGDPPPQVEAARAMRDLLADHLVREVERYKSTGDQTRQALGATTATTSQNVERMTYEIITDLGKAFLVFVSAPALA